MQEANMPVVQKGIMSRTGPTQSSHFCLKLRDFPQFPPSHVTEVHQTVTRYDQSYFTSLHVSSEASSSYQPKMLQVRMLQGKAHKSDTCVQLTQVSPGSFKAKLRQLAKRSKCYKHFKRKFSSSLFCFPRNKHPINVVWDQGAHQSKVRVLYAH